MPDLPITPALAVVVLGLLATTGWGAADFGGGLLSRGAPVLGVLLGSQLASLAVAVPIVLAANEPALRPIDIAISIAGGALGAGGLALLYRGLSVGRMGVVAPVAAVLTATLPVAFGFATQGVPSWLAVLGIILAAFSVVLVSRTPAPEDARPSGLRYGLASGLLFGLFTVAVSGLNDELLMSPIALMRVVMILTVGGWLVARRGAWRVPRRLWPALLAVGVTDMAATAAYLGAIAVGPLAIAAILSSLYPVVTTILATVVLRERVTAGHAAGILAAGVAVALIAGASAG